MTQVWSVQAGSAVIASPAVADGIVVVGTKDRKIRAFRESDGLSLWSVGTQDEVLASPTIDRGRVYAAVADGTLRCLELETGSTVWTVSSRGTHLGSPLVLGNTLYHSAGFPERHLRALDTATGALRWQVDLGQLTSASPAVDSGRIYTADNRGRVYAFDAATGASVWTFEMPETPLFSSPVVSGGYVWMTAGRSLYRIHKDPAMWSSANATYSASDPAAPARGYPWWLNKTVPSVSSPAVVGGRIVFVVRFDSYFDNYTNWEKKSDEVVMREFAVAVDPVSMTPAWQIILGVETSADINRVPQLSLCPTPAAFLGGSGIARAAVASSVEASLRIVENGAVVESVPVSSRTRSSPAVANARILVGSDIGILHSFQGSANGPPLPPSAGAPAGDTNVNQGFPVLSWAGASDLDGDVLTGLVRIDDDGEVLRNWDGEFTTAETTWTFDSAVEGARYTWRVRAVDPDGAMSGWSESFSFWYRREHRRRPAPVTGLSASPGDGRVDLAWTASATPGVLGYRLSWREGRARFGPEQSIGSRTSHSVIGLANASTHTFRVTAVGSDGLESRPAEVSAVPLSACLLNGTPIASLAAAVLAARDGDTILLGYGTFPVSSTLFVREGVRIVGQGAHRTVIDGAGTDRLISVLRGSGNPVTIRLVALSGAGTAIDANGGQVRIANAVLRNNRTALYAPPGSTAEAMHVTFFRNEQAAVHAVGSSVSARNNLLIRNGSGVLAESASMRLRYNDAFGNTVNYSGASPGAGSISADVAFVDSEQGDFRERPGQPSIDAADPSDPYGEEPRPNGRRANLGAYGNTEWATETRP